MTSPGASGASGLMYGYAAPDVVELVITWLLPLDGDVGPQRYAGQELPYRWVSDAPGGVDDKVTQESTLSVHTFAADYWSARQQAALTHRRMLVLGPPMAAQQRVTLAGNRTVFVDGVETAEPPTWQDYGENTIHRFVARYTINLRFKQV